ncbi:glycosyltransferase [Bacillus sp. RO3]|nr:glycosyltransferase [Bacillus sp. RO3]
MDQVSIQNRLQSIKKLKAKLQKEIDKEKEQIEAIIRNDRTVIHSNAKTSNDILELTQQEINSYLEKRDKLADLHFLENALSSINQIPDSNGSKFYSKKDVKIGIIADEFLYQSFKGIAEFVYITQKNYKQYADQLDVFFIATTWRGLNKEWRGLGNPQSKRRDELREIINLYKEKDIKVVFFSKEDPVNYDLFVGIAQDCDYIFTTAREKVEDYKKDCKNENVDVLSFGINPLYHNPIGMRKFKKRNEVFFAGSWYQKYPHRQEDTKMIFNGIKKSDKGLKIIDRNYSLNHPNYFFPEEYLESVSPEVPHEHLQKLHKLYDWSLNFNSVKYSETMFANRIYELQAIGNIIISNYSLAINNKFPNVFIVNSENEVKDILHGFTEEEIYKHQMYGLRQVMNRDTTFDRISFVLEKLQLNEKPLNRNVAVVVRDITHQVEKSFNAQTYENKSLILEKDLTAQLLAEYDMVAFFSSENVYYEYYLEDMVNGFKFTDSDYITKDAYLHGHELVPGVEHDYVDKMPDKYRTVFWSSSFSVDDLVKFEGEVALPNGYSIDRFEFNSHEAKQTGQSENYMLSVIVPIYNNGKYLLNKCFNSLRRSSVFHDMEIILVDDGSSDRETLINIKRLERDYPNVKSFSYTDGGSGSASRPRNKGIELASAPYVTYLDPDNEAINDGYAKLLEIITSDKKLDMVVGNIIKIDNTKSIKFNYYNTVLKYNKEGLIKDAKEFLKKVNLRAQSIQALVVKKDIIVDNHLTMVERAGGQDTLFFHELLIHARKTKVIDLDIHIYYAAVEGSVTNTITKKFFTKFHILEKERLPFLLENGLMDVYMDKRFDFYFTNWYMKRLVNIQEDQLEESLHTLYEIYSLYKDYIKNESELLKRFDQLYRNKKYMEIVDEVKLKLK